MKNICLPEISRVQNKIIQKYENTTIALIFFDLATVSGSDKICKKIGNFYDKLFGRFQGWVNNDFENYSKNQYINDNDPRKKFRYVPYELKFLSTASISEQNMLNIHLKITLSKRKDVISEKNIYHRWNLKSGTLIIPKKQRKIRKAKLLS